MMETIKLAVRRLWLVPAKVRIFPANQRTKVGGSLKQTREKINPAKELVKETFDCTIYSSYGQINR